MFFPSGGSWARNSRPNFIGRPPESRVERRGPGDSLTIRGRPGQPLVGAGRRRPYDHGVRRLSARDVAAVATAVTASTGLTAAERSGAISLSGVAATPAGVAQG